MLFGIVPLFPRRRIRIQKAYPEDGRIADAQKYVPAQFLDCAGETAQTFQEVRHLSAAFIFAVSAQRRTGRGQTHDISEIPATGEVKGALRIEKVLLLPCDDFLVPVRCDDDAHVFFVAKSAGAGAL